MSHRPGIGQGAWSMTYQQAGVQGVAVDAEVGGGALVGGGSAVPALVGHLKQVGGAVRDTRTFGD
jgi:hypothetical protein